MSANEEFIAQVELALSRPLSHGVVIPLIPLTHESVPATQGEVATPCEDLWIRVPRPYICWPWYDGETPEVKVFTEDGKHVGYVLREQL